MLTPRRIYSLSITAIGLLAVLSELAPVEAAVNSTDLQATTITASECGVSDAGGSGFGQANLDAGRWIATTSGGSSSIDQARVRLSCGLSLSNVSSTGGTAG